MDYAKEKGLVLPAFNTTNYELTAGIIRGYQEKGLGGYIAISSSNLKLSNPKIIADMVKSAMKEASVPVALHLDHGKSFEDVKACIEAGFTSIMVDASHLPFEENIAITKEVVDVCHKIGVSVEGELGTIGNTGTSVEGGVSEVIYTKPEDAEEFIEKTGIDTLAVAIGTAHGIYPKDIKPELKMDVLEDIKSRVDIPLVLHGGSANPDEESGSNRDSKGQYFI